MLLTPFLPEDIGEGERKHPSVAARSRRHRTHL